MKELYKDLLSFIRTYHVRYDELKPESHLVIHIGEYTFSVWNYSTDVLPEGVIFHGLMHFLELIHESEQEVFNYQMVTLEYSGLRLSILRMKPEAKSKTITKE